MTLLVGTEYNTKGHYHDALSVAVSPTALVHLARADALADKEHFDGKTTE